MMRPTLLLLRRLRPLLDRTLDLDPAEREAYLERLAREAPADAREVAALLAAEPALDAAHFLCGVPFERCRARSGGLEAGDSRQVTRFG